MKRHDVCVLVLAFAPLLTSADSGSQTPMFWEERSDLAVDECSATLDCREVFPVARLVNEPALQGLMYSAFSWSRGAVEDPTRRATVTARAGMLVNGVFTPDGSSPITLLSAAEGEGTFDWQALGVSKQVYQLTHEVTKGSVTDAEGACCGYLDFTRCNTGALQDYIEAVLAEFTHEIAVEMDDTLPWQPADVTTPRSGLFTDAALDQDDETSTTFSFRGIGVFYYEYSLDGGQLRIVVDGADGEDLSVAGGWTVGAVEFQGDGDHEVSFTFTSTGDGAVAGLRNVCWTRAASSDCAKAEADGKRMDLREGVRKPEYLSQVLPFTYSSTNWIGDVAGVTAESVAKVTIVQLVGTDPDVRNWTEVVPNTFAELVKKPGEGAIKWKPSKGVWKATFDILNGEGSIYQETAFLDLRNSRSSGFALILSSLYTFR